MEDDGFYQTGKSWAAVDDPNPSAVADARRRWLSDGPAPNAAAQQESPWLKDSYTYQSSVAQPAPAMRFDPAGARSARVADTGVKPSHGPVVDSEAQMEQIRTLKKELSAARAENRLLKVGKERAHAELRKAEYEGEQALKTGAIVDASGVAGVKPEVRLLKQLKAKTRDLESEVKSKAQIICELGEAGKNVRVRELESGIISEIIRMVVFCFSLWDSYRKPLCSFAISVKVGSKDAGAAPASFEPGFTEIAK